jgi:hypothetical protein
VFVDTEAYDTSRIPAVNNFFLSLIRSSSDASISHCGADEESDGTFDAGLFLEPGNFARTDLLAESSYRVSADAMTVSASAFVLSPT